MAKKKATKKPIKKISKKRKENQRIKDRQKKTSAGDFSLNPKYYKELDEFKIYSDEKRVAKIFGAREKGRRKRFIRITSKSKRPFGWRFNYGVNLYNSLNASKLIRGISKIVKKLRWKIAPSDDIEKLKIQLREKEEAIISLEKSSEEARQEHEKFMNVFQERQKEILESRAKDFRSDIKQLKDLINKAKAEKVAESELQEFLYQHSWFFGSEYINAEPQKMRGARSKFDFYLERFNKTHDIIEIKLLSDPIINKDGSISAKVIQAVDQLIKYMESAIAVAHSRVISEEEGIRELRPRGVVIIGIDDSGAAREKLRMWNYQLAHITILTYEDVVERGQSLLRHLKEERSIKTAPAPRSTGLKRKTSIKKKVKKIKK